MIKYFVDKGMPEWIANKHTRLVFWKYRIIDNLKGKAEESTLP